MAEAAGDRMLELARSLPEQLLAGFDNAGTAATGPLPTRLRSDGAAPFVVTGMGGSGISGSLLAGLSAAEAAVPILCCRDYDLPAAVTRRSPVVAISYSGNTEETLSAFRQARRRRCPIAVITGGGELLAEARRARLPAVPVPTGLPPRAALGLLFGSLLALAGRVGVIRLPRREVVATAAFLSARRDGWQRRAGAFVRRLGDRLPLVYATSRLTEPVADRWRCQLNENAKLLCHTGVLPEHNHNEIVGMGAPAAARDSHIFALVGPETHPRTRARLRHVLAITRGEYRGGMVIGAEGDSRLAQALSLVMLGDLFSVKLARARGVDPLPVARIDELKRRMAKEKDVRNA